MSAYYRYPVVSGGGSGTVTSVGLADTSTTAIYTISGSPVTTSGTIDIQLNTQSANKVFAGPSSGSPAQPTFRSLVANDVPSLSYVSAVTGTAPVVSSGGLTPAISMPVATTSVDGYLSHVDWNTFNGKQASGNYITALTGDATASGPGSTALTLASVVTAGTSPKVTYNAKGLVTGGTTLSSSDIPNNAANTTGTASNITATSNSTLTTLSALSLPYSQVTGGPSTNAITALTGDVTASGPGSVASTLATVNTNTGSFGSAAAIPNFTVNGKGLITAAGSTALKAPTVQAFTSGTGTYTTPTSPAPLYLRVQLVGGGGGGGGGSSSTAGGGTGGATTFGTSLLVANGGLGGSNLTAGGVGGTASITTSSTVFQVAAFQGSAGTGVSTSSTANFCGGAGGDSFFGGGGTGGSPGSSGSAGAANSGSGGGGGGGANASVSSASGGGSGGYCEAIITSPSSSYATSVGAGGAGATGSTTSGGAGAAGYIVVTAYYQ